LGLPAIPIYAKAVNNAATVVASENEPRNVASCATSEGI
jgi:hypothetical protein